MRLAPRLVLSFGFVAVLSAVGLGYVVREDERASETMRFEREVASACDRVVSEIVRQAERDRKLVTGACQSGELADRALIWLEGGTLDDERRLALSRLVPEERVAFDLDELVLATADGELLGEDPMALLGAPRAAVKEVVGGDVSRFALRPGREPAIVARCRKAGVGGVAVGLAGARHLTPVIERIGKTIDASVAFGVLGPASRPPEGRADASASCVLADGAGVRVPVVVSRSQAELTRNLARIDRTIVFAGLAATGVALILAVLLARSLGRPIAELASEARKVASGTARPLRVRGPGEIVELASAFDTMLVDLETMRRRLGATSRIAAWREVARRVAHEIKNPLAPIRAAVETLRRLRARQDPEFDAYFDQATRIVLDEVHRISNIVTEFTRFARLAPPQPVETDLVELARQVIALHEANDSGAHLTLDVDTAARGARGVPLVRADPDQILRVLTNLVQNALYAVASKGIAGEVRLSIVAENASLVAVTVADNGPGLAPEIASRLFEPYATDKPNGTGLGLAIAQRIAIEHDGELAYVHPTGDQDGGRGAAFRLVLPVDGPPPQSGNGPA